MSDKLTPTEQEFVDDVAQELQDVDQGVEASASVSDVLAKRRDGDDLAAAELPDSVVEARAELEQLGEADKEAPVYDDRGNVRPRGYPGAVPMTKAERIAIAKRLERESL